MSNNEIEKNMTKLFELKNYNSDNICKDIEEFINDGTLDNEVASILNHLIEELRDYYIKNDSEMYSFNNNFDSEVVKKLFDVIKSTLWVYDAFAIVRDDTLLQEYMKLLDDIFENCILRRDLDYLNEITIREDASYDKLKLRRLINAFRGIVYDCISKLLSEKSIKKSFELNTGINPILANSISQNIDSHFMELKINYIIENLPDSN